MKDNVLKYKTRKIYCYTYSELLDTVEDIIWNFMGLMRSTGSGPQIDRWLEWSVIHARRVKYTDIR